MNEPAKSRSGGPEDLDVEQMLPGVYEELRALAQRAFRASPGNVTLQPTALIHEVYLRMAGRKARWRSRTHFFSIAGRAMRQVLQNHFRDQHAQKRGGGRWQRVTLTGRELSHGLRAVELSDLQDALGTVERLDPSLAQIVELRFFAGLTVEEIAEHLGVSTSKVEKDWRLARALLRAELGPSAPGSSTELDSI